MKYYFEKIIENELFKKVCKKRFQKKIRKNLK